MLAYIVAVDLPKEKFVRTVSTMYFIGSFPLYRTIIKTKNFVEGFKSLGVN